MNGFKGILVGFWAAIVLTLIPMYITNSSAMLFGGKTPLDLNAKAWDNHRWLGKGKTFKGTFFGIFFGTLSASIIESLFSQQVHEMTSNFVLFGFVLSIGAIVGDLIGSFLKRRFGLQSGSPVWLLDQLDFLAGGLVFGSLLFVPTLSQIGVMVIVTLLIHRLANWIAFKTNLKEVPW